MSQNTIPGGWTPYHPLTTEDKAVFEEATKGLLGVDYNPLEVSTQVVKGINYRFLCDASIPPAGVIWRAIVEIYAAPGQRPVVTQIHRL